MITLVGKDSEVRVHPIKFAKDPERWKKTVEIIREKRNLILQSNNKMRWKRSVFSGVSLDTRSVDIMFKNDKNYMCLEKAHFSIPLQYIDVVRWTKTTKDVLQQQCIDDSWNVDGDRKLSGPGPFSTQFTTPSHFGPYGYMCVLGRRPTNTQATSRPEYMWPEVWSNMSKNISKKKNSIGPKKSRSSTMPDIWKEIIILIRKIQNSKKLWRTRNGISWAMQVAKKLKKNSRKQPWRRRRYFHKSNNAIDKRQEAIPWDDKIHRSSHEHQIEAHESQRYRVQASGSKESWRPHCWQRE